MQSALAVVLVATGIASAASLTRWLMEEPGDLRSLVSIPHQRPAFGDRFLVASFDDRFQPAIETPLATLAAPTVMGGAIAWFDPAYSFGSSGERFIKPEAIVQQIAELPPRRQETRQVAMITPLPTSRPAELRDLRGPQEPATPRTRAAFSHDALVKKARLALIASAKSDNPNWLAKLFGREEAPPVMAYASASADDITASVKSDDTPGPLDRLTAVYDITAKTVYMPDGSKLEAHSGLGAKLDKPDYAHVKMQGVTPPHVYDLKPREALFHGVAALRMTPLGGEGAIHGRTGLLAHTYMLGPNGDSNGCVSFKDYDRFLQAYNKGQIKRIVVVGSLN